MERDQAPLSTTENSLLDQKTFVLITGASRGIGREIAIQLSKRVGKNSHFLLVARDEAKLEETVKLMNGTSSKLIITKLIADLAKLESLNRIDAELQRLSKSPSDVAIIVHNAATLGDVSKKACKLNNSEEIQQYLQLNVTSMICLTSLFLRAFGGAKRAVINVSSLLAVQGMPCFSLYATGKAARDSYMRVLAVEEPSVRVLNYAPGPIATDMHTTIAQNAWSSDIREWSEKGVKEQTMVNVNDSVAKLLQILHKNCFESGAHIDFYDEDAS